MDSCPSCVRRKVNFSHKPTELQGICGLQVHSEHVLQPRGLNRQRQTQGRGEAGALGLGQATATPAQLHLPQLAAEAGEEVCNRCSLNLLHLRGPARSLAWWEALINATLALSPPLVGVSAGRRTCPCTHLVLRSRGQRCHWEFFES